MDDIKVGNQYFAWTVIALDDGHHYGKVLCRCKCGTVRWVFSSPLHLGKTHSCGCRCSQPLKDYGLKVGDKVGHWTLLRREKNKFYCRCSCGTERWVYALYLMRGKSLSCGCKRLDVRSQKQIKRAMKKGHELRNRLGKERLDVKYSGFGRKKNKNSKTGVTGVSFHKKTGKYRAYIFVARHQIDLGLFNTISEAAAARRDAEKKYFAPRQKKADEIIKENKNEK